MSRTEITKTKIKFQMDMLIEQKLLIMLHGTCTEMKINT
jgi:hypothetical protein